MAAPTILLALAAALDPSALRLIPPDAGFLLGIEWRQTLESASGGVLQKRLAESGLSAVPGLASLEKALREDVDAVLATGPTRGMGRSSGQTPLLVIVRGRFDAAAVRKWAPGRAEAYKQYTLLAPRNIQPPTLRLAVLDANTLLLGDRKLVVAAIDRLASARAQIPARLVQRAGELAARHQIWLALEAPPEGFPAQSGAPAQILSQLTGLDFGISFAAGVDLEARLAAASDPAARDMATAVQGLLAMAALNQGQSPETTELLRKLQVTTAGTTVSLRVSLTEAELNRAMTAQAQAPRPAAAPVAAPAAAPASTAAVAPAGPKKIRIFGLEEGTKEVLVK